MTEAEFKASGVRNSKRGVPNENRMDLLFVGGPNNAKLTTIKLKLHDVMASTKTPLRSIPHHNHILRSDIQTNCITVFQYLDMAAICEKENRKEYLNIVKLALHRIRAGIEVCFTQRYLSMKHSAVLCMDIDKAISLCNMVINGKSKMSNHVLDTRDFLIQKGVFQIYIKEEKYNGHYDQFVHQTSSSIDMRPIDREV